MSDDCHTIEGRYTVTSESSAPLTPRREPIIGSWKALAVVAGFVALRYLAALYRHH
jgi:hypothetical protein